MKISPSTILITLTAAIFAGGAYWHFFVNGATDQPPLTSTGVSDNPAQAQFQALIAELKPITFDTGIFEDPRFFALHDLKTAITEEPAGRPDPFAPVAGLRAQ